MTVEAGLRLIAGTLVLASAVAGMFLDVRFLWFTMFVGANLMQSAVTGWCPMMFVLRRLHLRECEHSTPHHV
jgi:hypothetical protein